MENRWASAGDGADGDHGDDLDACVYGSRLLGRDPALVLHGGGNTSVKQPYRDLTGKTIDTLYVKGSGWDLATIERPGFTPLRHDRLLELLALDALSDVDMMRELSAASLDPAAPAPSVETLLHALLPHRAVQHSHADAIVTLTNTAEGERTVADLYGPDVLIIPYVMPGFDLAKVASRMWENDRYSAMVLLNHGLFTFADTTRQAYERHIELVSLAEAWLDDHAPLAPPTDTPAPPCSCLRLAELRRQLSEVAGKPLIVQRHWTPPIAHFVSRPDLESLADRGPLTPDHVLRTKRTALVGTDVAGYATAYRSYFEHNAARSDGDLRMVDLAPRIIVDPEIGLLGIGETAKASGVAAEIYAHTIPVLERAEDHLGGYVALPAEDIFDVEYWSLEQAKLALAGPRARFSGCVAIVTGAASGIGRACAEALLAEGCAVSGFDRDPSVEGTFEGPNWLGQAVDVTDAEAQQTAIDTVVERFGGVDIVVAAAGIFGPSAPLRDLDADAWRSVQAVNVDAIAFLLSSVHGLLALSPVGGRVVIIGSKNVPAPGKGAAAYSASKSAVTQLARVAALEWADDGIRVNVVHPDAVFDTGLWDDETLQARAAQHGLTVEEYKARNLLGTTVNSKSVATVVAELASDTFGATTGAQIPIDGGNTRVV
ncbi:bifunctional aldolase/short-chain dehydrogenase [Candidatus Poriferisocius sp.]|uniref:bifunctional aldolase/short-chain dehydrogenase n=1 Tax=Candidatus Poriferisocius sp. TaxID=3101276 RepID=UPI003B5993AC